VEDLGQINLDDEVKKRFKMVYIPNWFSVDLKTGVCAYCAAVFGWLYCFSFSCSPFIWRKQIVLLLGFRQKKLVWHKALMVLIRNVSIKRLKKE
jgi:hypothetical protein